MLKEWQYKMKTLILAIVEWLMGKRTAVNIIPSPSTEMMTPSMDNSKQCKEKDGYYVWVKGGSLLLNKYFSTKEFTCQCKLPECKDQKISKELISRLTIVREEMNKPMSITSGFRFEAHQSNLQKSGANTVVATKSTHCLGHGADAYFKDFRLDEWKGAAEKVFNAIGLGRNFLHLDIRDDKKRFWLY